MVDADDLDDPEISALKDRLLSLMSMRGLSEDEKRIKALGWDAESWAYIGSLLARAGAVRAKSESWEGFEHVGHAVCEPGAVGQSAGALRGEKRLYAPIAETLSSAWVLEHGIQDHVLDITASQGGRVTGGKWSRPDITLGSSNEYRYVAGRSVEIRTFEVKTREGLDITAIYEALSHRRAAHFAHVLVYVPEHESSEADLVLQRVITDAEAYGVGVTTFADPRDYKTWRVKAAARRANPDAAAIDAFIHAQMGAKFKDKVISWCRRV